MTKEKFITNILDMVIYGGDTIVAKQFLDEFFESNVCIPKGENRHPYADVLHEWLEGAEVEYQNTLGKIDGWAKLSFQLSKYRIKPSEPVYVYQWVCTTNDFEMRTAHITDEDFEKSNLQYDYWCKDLSTRQERK